MPVQTSDTLLAVENAHAINSREHQFLHQPSEMAHAVIVKSKFLLLSLLKDSCWQGKRLSGPVEPTFRPSSALFASYMFFFTASPEPPKKHIELSRSIVAKWYKQLQAVLFFPP